MKCRGYNMCSSCEAGEIMDNPADVKVQGTDRERRPYHAWLCVDHLTMQLDDGATLRVVKRQDVTGFYK